MYKTENLFIFWFCQNKENLDLENYIVLENVKKFQVK